MHIPDQIRPGMFMPELIFPSLEGEDYDLSRFQGKKVLINIWASWSGSRDQLPLWQKLSEDFKDQGSVIIGIASDALGPERPMEYVKQAGVNFLNLIDHENLLGSLMGYKVIPCGVLIDEKGQIQHIELAGFDIREESTRVLLESWFAGAELHITARFTRSLKGNKAIELFKDGLDLYRRNNQKGAVAAWKKAVRFDPDNFVIRKQLWALEYPDKFYAGKIDFEWQRELIEKGV